jgi:hypothetical protein
MGIQGMARIILVTGVIMTFAVGTVAATETGLMMPAPSMLQVDGK